MEGCLEIVGENEFSKYLDTEKFSLYRKFIVNDVIDKSPNVIIIVLIIVLTQGFP